MELYLIRHAEALELGERGITTDEERPLSEKGEKQSEAAARALQARGIALDALYTSPLRRALQTAEILNRVWGETGPKLEVCDTLAPGSKLRKLSKTLLKMEAERIGLVGHMPHLGDFAAWLLGDKRMQIEIAKAGVVCFDCGEMPTKGMGVLKWMVTPEWY